MADEGLRIVNSVDNSQVKSSFADMRREIVNSAQTAQAEGKKIDNAIDRVALTAATASDQLKKKIYEASQTVNTLSAKIIEQKDVVREVQADVRKLGEEYKKALKNGSIGASGKLAEFNAAKKALEEEKAALFGLNQERSKAQLKVKELRGQMELLKKTSDEGAQAVEFLKRGLAAIGGFQALKGFTAQVIQTRGEFQQLEVAFTTMLGSAEKANALMMQLTKTAAVTPFYLKGVTDGAKQLLAYGVAADEVNDTLIHLGDIAAGLSLPLGDLVYLYGTTLTQGRMFTQDLRQFMGRGIPIAEELAKQFGVTKDKVQELVSTGKVGAEEFKQAIMAMSSEGGKFGGLMEEKSKTITGQISNIEDAIDSAFNKIGKQSEGVINTALDGVSYLVENYEKVGKVILSVAGVYGTYKAAVLAVIAAEKIAAAARLAHLRQQTLLQLATDVLTKKMALLKTTMLMNPWVLAATAIAGLIAVLINLETQADRVKKAEEDLNNEREEAIRLEQEHKSKIEELCSIAGNEELSTENRRLALVKLEQQYPTIFAKYDTEAEKLAHIIELKNAINEADGKKSVTVASNEYAKNQKEVEALEKLGAGHYESSYQYGQHSLKFVGRNSEQEARLTALRKRQQELSKQIQKDKGDAYMTNLTGVSNEDLQAQINARKNLLALMKLEGKKYGTTTTGGVKGTFTADELQGQLQVMQSEINRRNEATYTPAQRKAQLASELASAKKALADFDKTSSKFTVSEAEAQRKKLQDAVSDAEKKYKAMGGDTSNSKAESAAKKREADEKRRQANEKAIAQEIAQLNASTELAVIESKEDGVKKRLELADYEHKQELAKIDKKHADLVEKRGGNLTAEEEAAFTKAREQADKDYHDKAQQILTEEWKAQYDAMYGYLKEYGSVESMRLAIRKEYDKKIEQSDDEWIKRTLKKERDAAMDSITSENLLKNVDLANVFSDYGVALAAPLEEALRQLKEYTKTADFHARSFEDKKSIYQTINNIDKRLNGISSVSFAEIGQNLNAYNDALVEFRVASDGLTKAAEDVIAAEEAVRQAEVALAMATTDEAKAAAKAALAKAKAAAAAANTSYDEKQGAFNQAQTTLMSAQTQASESLQGFQASIQKVGDVARAVASGSMKQLWEALGKKTQDRIAEFITGTHAITEEMGLVISELAGKGKGIDFLTDKIKTLASDIFAAGEEIDSSDIAGKVQKLFSEIFGDKSSEMGDVMEKIAGVLNQSLSKAKEDGEDMENAVTHSVSEITQLISKITGKSGSLWGMIIGLIFDLLDILAEGIGGLVQTILDKVGAAVEGILTEIGSGKFFERIATGIGNLIASVVRGIANLFSGGFAFGGSNVDDMEKEISKLADANEALSKSIDTLSSQISKSDSTNQQSIEAYKKALEAEKEWEENQRKAINNRASEWTNSGYGFLKLGGKHSFNYHLNDKGKDWWGWNNFNDTLKQHGYNQTVNSAQELWNLSPEMMQLLRDYAPSAWSEMLNSDGHRNPSELIDEYINRAGKIDELTSAINEKLTGYTWEGFLDSYKSILKDLTSTTEDFADNIGNMISNALLENLVNDEFAGRIKKLYQYIAEHSGDGLDANEIAYINRENESIANDMINRRQNLIDAGLIKEGEADAYKQEASTKGFQAMSQDTGDELNGRFTAMVSLQAETKDLTALQNELLTQLNTCGTGIKTSVEALQTALATSNIHLSDIAKYTKELQGSKEILEEIRDNTKHL